MAKCGWEVVLRKEPRGVWVFSKQQRMDEVQCISLGRTSYFSGLHVTGLYDDLVPKTPILGDVVEVGPEVVAKGLERLEVQDDTSVDDLEYCKYDNDWLPGRERQLYTWNFGGHVFDTCICSVVLSWPHNSHINSILSSHCLLMYLETSTSST